LGDDVAGWRESLANMASIPKLEQTVAASTLIRLNRDHD
jgi:hypothetical protein